MSEISTETQTAVLLTDNIIRRIAEFSFGTINSGERSAFVTQVGNPVLSRKVNFEGSSETFAYNFVNTAANLGRDTLIKVLRTHREHFGVDKQQECDDLIQMVEAAPLRTTTATPGSVIRPYPTGLLPTATFLPQNPYFVGREALLQELSTDLAADGATTVVTALNGLGGIGKTQTAIAYCYRFQAAYQTVLWLRAESLLTLLTSLSNLCEPFGITPGDKIEENAHAVWQRIEATTKPILMVWDNADSPEELADFRPKSANIRLLITSRRMGNAPEWKRLGKVTRRSVDILPVEECVALFIRLVESSLPDIAKQSDDIRTLCEDLGQLPLAIEQAAAYVEVQQCTVASYRALLEKDGLKILDAEKATASDYANVVGVTWKANFDAIAKTHPESVRLAHALSFLDGDGIGEQLLGIVADGLGSLQNNPPTDYGSDEATRNTALALYARYCLIQRKEGVLTIHRLTQAAIRHSLPDQKTVCEQIVTALWQVAPPVKFETWKVWGGLIPHIQRVFHHADLNHLALQTVDLGSLLNEGGGYLNEQGLYPQALPLYEHALAIRESALGANHPDTALSLNNLAELYRGMGRYADALPLVECALAIRESALGASHPDTATSLNNLAALYKNMGRVADALPLYERALAIYESALGASHPSTATSLNNLAGLYENMGNYADALPLYERALAIYESALGASHPSTANSLNDLALLYKNMGRYADALPLFERALAINESELGASHPSTATSLNNLAGLYYSMGRVADALPLFERTVQIFESALGANHPSTATSLDNLAGLYYSMGRVADALPLFERTVQIFESALGASHPDTARSLNNLAALYDNMGRVADALPLYERALAICKSELGASHPSTATSLNNLAVFHAKQGEWEKALPLMERAVQIRIAVLGKANPDTQSGIQSFMGMLVASGRITEEQLRAMSAE